MKMTSQHAKIRQITPLCPKSIIYSKMHTANMHVSNRKVVYKGDIDQRSMPKNIPSLAPVMYMICFTSQLMTLRPNFVRPHVPRESDHVIRHMVRFNTEAYANL